ncbi:MAG TPA: hypothetical protein VII98_09275 [Solirubrobacteraceae bacterium]
MSTFAARLRAAWGELFAEQRLAAVAAIALVLSMFLPWYQQTGFAISRGGTQKVEDSLSAFQSWGFVEASILLVALAVLLLLFARAERRAFHLPFGDGIVIVAAGAWVMFLVFYRQVDKPAGSDTGALKTTIGVNWGIFIAFLLGALLAYAGWRMHSRARPEPVVDGDDPRTTAVEGDPTSVAPREPITMPTAVAGRPQRARRTPRRGDDGQFEGQLSFDDPDAP